ncbi:hypothetical protein GCM10027578_39830 [Spirosoma luteolum]
MLTVSDFHKAYEGRTVLRISSLTLPDGVHYFRGGNGSGKTTFLRTVAGMLPFDGSIWLDGQYEIGRDPVAYRFRVTYAEAEPLYPDFLTARELTRFVARARQAPHGQTARLGALLGVDLFWDQPTRTFSSGMLKKLALLLALLGSPRLLLLDEPLTTLDVETAGRLFAYLHDLHRRQQVSIWLTSHQDVALTELPLTATWHVGNEQIQRVD